MVSLQCSINIGGRSYGSSTTWRGIFYARLFSRKLRYRRIAPWLHYNGVAVLSLIGIEQRVAVRFRCVSTRQCLIVQNISVIMNETSIFSYNGSSISFFNGKNVMVNATEMARVFGKRPVDYLRLPSTSELIKAIVRKSHISENQLVTTQQGSTINGGGTWMHEDVALDFAQWLSVDFKLWCNDRIKELLTQGVTTVNDDDVTILHAMQVLQKRVDEKQRALEFAQETITTQNEQLKLQAPKVKYVDDVLQSVNTYTSTQMSKELGLREAEQLHKILKEKGVMFKQSGQWMLTAKYCEHGYTKPRTHQFTRNDGSVGTSTTTVWTEKGRVFLHDMFNLKKAQETA